MKTRGKSTEINRAQYIDVRKKTRAHISTAWNE